MNFVYYILVNDLFCSVFGVIYFSIEALLQASSFAYIISQSGWMLPVVVTSVTLESRDIYLSSTQKMGENSTSSH